jgi:hypothetical protein
VGGGVAGFICKSAACLLSSQPFRSGGRVVALTQTMRECPFKLGRQYRVRKSFNALRDSFSAGEVLTFERDARSRYDGITGYFFRRAGTDTLRVWDIDDEADIIVWKDLFEEAF